MRSFSNLIDISSFFIGVLINLLLVALVCYYFKRKIDNLELSQSEQAKMLYSLISRQEEENMAMHQQSSENKEIDFNGNNMNFLQNLDLNSLGTTGNYIINNEEENKIIELNGEPNNTEEEEESDEDSDEESDEETVENSDEETEEEKLEDNLTSNEQNVIKSIQYDETETPSHYDYEKMTIKELKAVIEKKGLSVKKNSKKNELIEVLVQQNTMENTEVIPVDKVEVTEILEDGEIAEESRPLNEIELDIEE